MSRPGHAAAEKNVLHLAPHPDDEVIGSPGALMALRDSGWVVVNLACSLGAEPQKARRGAEVREACRRAGFELLVADACDSEAALADVVLSAVSRSEASLVVAPSPHDAHPGHEAVGRAAVEACERLGREAGASPRLWLWGLWADLPFPTLAVAFGHERMREILHCLEAHEGELARNDYRRLVRGRAEMNASLGPERVFGFGSPAALGVGEEYVEVLCEIVLAGGAWRLGRRRWLDTADPLDDRSSDARADNAKGEQGDSTVLPVSRVPFIDSWVHG